MSLISINEEMASAGMDVDGSVDPEPTSARPALFKLREHSNLAVEPSSGETERRVETVADEFSETRLYLAAMTYFFSGRG